MSIKTGHDVFNQSNAEWTSTMLASLARRAGAVIKSSDQRIDRPISAHVNHGRWIVVCDECNSAHVVWPDDPVFLCGGCFNAHVKGRWRPIVFPSESAQIAELLASRPEKNQNWLPHETIDDLRAQNADHGLETTQ